MNSRIKTKIFVLFVLSSICARASDLVTTQPPPDALQIQSVSVQGKPLKWHSGGSLNLGSLAENILFHFGPPSNSVPPAGRVRFKLEGFDPGWRDGEGEMFVALRFCDEQGERVSQQFFSVRGESTGWNGTLESSVLTHRRETIVVPPRSTRLEIIISSAGPPATVGIYAVEDLMVWKLTTYGNQQVLVSSPFAEKSHDGDVDQLSPDWLRDGISPRMAKIVELGKAPKTKALAIVDDDLSGHAEWDTRKSAWPQVLPGDSLVVEWNELYSVGLGDVSQEARYDRLPPGDYKFRVKECTVLGEPTEIETALAIHVPQPLWEQPLCWTLLAAIVVAGATGSVRYAAWQRVRRTMSRLEQQRALEEERLRIARDIHDDLGARVTQISLLSALAQGDPAYSDQARAQFDRISRMSRDLVSALYETVWAVNPENDNLEAVGNYLCQRINEFCTQAQLRCRLDVAELPRSIEVSSQTRHNICMAVKEAVHNVIKHANASQITLRVALSEDGLTISIEDDGNGAEPGQHNGREGNGWPNMKRRMEDIGGSCVLESCPGKGTTVRMRVRIQPSITDERAGSSHERPCVPAEFNLPSL